MSARFPRWSGLLVAFSLLVGLVGLVPMASPAGAYGSTITVSGHGWGHGRGLSQWGSLGYALFGTPYGSILNHYYGNTSRAVRSESLMTVNLVEIENHDLIVTSESAFIVDRGDGQVQLAVPAGDAVLVRRTSQGWAVYVSETCGGGGGWQLTKTYGSSDTPRIGTGYTGSDVYRMMRVCGPSGNVRSYRGILTAYSKGSNPGTWAVNTLPMELYLRGVVPRESPAYWGDAGGGDGIEALKAQAVAARSYALAEQRTFIYKAHDDTRSQVYGGAALNGTKSEDPRTDAAIAATAGEIRQKSNGSVARTEFGSSSGGYTAGGEFPAVRDDGDSVCVSSSLCNPNHNWTREVSVSAIQSAYPSIGTLTNARVTATNGLGDDGGRVTQMVLTGTSGSRTITGVDFYWALGLKSDWFSIGHQFWLAEPNGRVRSYGGAPNYGTLENQPLAKPIVGTAPTPTSNGFWLVASDGGIFTFGDAKFFGSTGAIRLNKPIVGMVSTLSGKGYWLVASDGGIFSFGDAKFYGSTGAMRLNKPIVGMAPTPSGKGYWLVASDGGIFTFGDAKFYGSTGSMTLVKPIVSMTAAPGGTGYWLVARDGGVFTFGSAKFHGSAASSSPYDGQRLVSNSTGSGYWVFRENGEMEQFGAAVGNPLPQPLFFTP
jgi:SpoIID/LytB domain protein